MRSEYEWVSMVRELQNEGVTIASLEEEINPKPSRKKGKKKAAS